MPTQSTQCKNKSNSLGGWLDEITHRERQTPGRI